ncbi:cupin domain-containing protein [Marinomonas sp. TI.3.20]|uniref:cupin domain-containing protein n=1 Tax=Marinomonas sp. TI.3.20 TaxID=3121296 RepID=UPI00311FE629
MITVVKPSTKQLEEINEWPIWEKESSQFDWKNDKDEMFYIIEGSANLSITKGITQEINTGDLVTVKKDVIINWDITSYIRKNFKFF